MTLACINTFITGGQGNHISHIEELGGKLEDSESATRFSKSLNKDLE